MNDHLAAVFFFSQSRVDEIKKKMYICIVA